jgi:hypothetical protein
MPWTAESFKKHNRAATQAQLRAGAKAANAKLDKSGDEGAAVRAGNAAIKAMRHNTKKKP